MSTEMFDLDIATPCILTIKQFDKGSKEFSIPCKKGARFVWTKLEEVNNAEREVATRAKVSGKA